MQQCICDCAYVTLRECATLSPCPAQHVSHVARLRTFTRHALFLCAAQYLEVYPNATADQVRRALVEELATPDTVMGAGPESTATLLFSNLTKGGPQGTVTPGGGTGSSISSTGTQGGGGLSRAALAAIGVFTAGKFCVPAVCAGQPGAGSANGRRTNTGPPVETPAASWHGGSTLVSVAKCHAMCCFMRLRPCLQLRWWRPCWLPS